MGMGSPLMLLVATGHRLRLGRGHWMLCCREITGFLLLLASIYYLGLFLFQGGHLLYAAGIAVIFMIGMTWRWLYDQDSWRVHRPSACLKIFFLGMASLLLISQWQPMATLGFLGKNHLPQILASQQAMDRALKKQPLLLVDYYADWCPSCQVLEADLAKPPFAGMLRAMAAHGQRYRVDISELDADKRTMMRLYQVPSPPALLLISKDRSGHLSVISRMIGYEGVSSLKHFFQALPRVMMMSHPRAFLAGKARA